MTTKLPKLPDQQAYDIYGCYTAAQMEAYAREAVADALRPNGDNAEHVRVLEKMRVGRHGWVVMNAQERTEYAAVTSALTAAIAALAQPKAEAVAWRDRDHEAGEWGYTDNPAWAAKYGERYQPLYTHPQPSVAVTEALDAAKDMADDPTNYSARVRLRNALAALTQGAANEAD